MSLKSNINFEEILKISLEMAPDCFCISDRDTILFCNGNFADIFGTTVERAIGSNHNWLLREAWQSRKGVKIDSEDFDDWLAHLEQIRSTTPVNQFETDLHDGRWFQMSRVSLDNGLSVVWGADITKLKQTQQALEQANEKIALMANTDQLTEVYNRRAFESIGKAELARAIRYEQPLSLLAMDLDHFKAINDEHGHDAGDDVLKQFAAMCSGLIREADVLCRIGGEEFVVILTMASCDEAREIANRMRMQIERTQFHIKQGSMPISVTASIGITQREEQDANIGDLLLRADKALYKAKNGGRNRIVSG